MSNLNSQEQFPKSFFHSKSIDRYEERAKVQSSSFLYGYQKLFTPLDFSHISLCYSLKLLTFRIWVTGIHTIPIMSKWNYVFRNVYK